MSDGRSASVFHVLGWRFHFHLLFSLDQEQRICFKLNADCLQLHFTGSSISLACSTKAWLNVTLIKPGFVLFCFVLFTFFTGLHWKNYFPAQGNVTHVRLLGMMRWLICFTDYSGWEETCKDDQVQLLSVHTLLISHLMLWFLPLGCKDTVNWWTN